MWTHTNEQMNCIRTNKPGTALLYGTSHPPARSRRTIRYNNTPKKHGKYKEVESAVLPDRENRKCEPASSASAQRSSFIFFSCRHADATGLKDAILSTPATKQK